jgi:hypothetical protein
MNREKTTSNQTCACEVQFWLLIANKALSVTSIRRSSPCTAYASLDVPHGLVGSAQQKPGRKSGCAYNDHRVDIEY